LPNRYNRTTNNPRRNPQPQQPTPHTAYPSNAGQRHLTTHRHTGAYWVVSFILFMWSVIDQSVDDFYLISILFIGILLALCTCGARPLLRCAVICYFIQF
jgi:hypothetical protein